MISNILKGAVLGLAMIIPGVSGGTMALVLGIYERLIRAIRGFSLSTLRDASGLLCGPEKKSRAATLWTSHDMSFLAILLAGAELREVPAAPYRNENNYIKVSGRLAEELAQTEPNGAIWANQFENVANRRAHIETTGPENWEQMWS